MLGLIQGWSHFFYIENVFIHIKQNSILNDKLPLFL